MLDKFRILLIVITMSMLLTACHNTKFRPNRSHVDKSKNKPVVHKGNFYSLSYCIKTALEYKTDYELYMLQKNIKDGNFIDKKFDSLFEQSKQNFFLNSNNSSSYIIDTNKLDQNINTLDFCMAYLNYFPKKDQRTTTIEQIQRIKQNLKFAVIKNYFKIALVQSLIKETEKFLLQSQNMAKFPSIKSRSMGGMDRGKNIRRVKKSLLLYRREYKKAYRELRILMGLVVKNKKVNTKWLKEINITPLYNIENLTKIALAKRPEFNGLNIAIDDVYKTSILMCPQFKISLALRDYTFYVLKWKETGIASAFVALKLPQQLETHSKTGYKAEAMRKIILAIGITAQVRMAHLIFLQAEENYKVDNRTYQAYKNYLNITKKSSSPDNRIAQMELKRLKLDTYECFIKRLASICNYYIAYYRLLNVLGVNSLDSANMKIMVDKIKFSEKNRKTENFNKAIIQRFIKTVKGLNQSTTNTTQRKFVPPSSARRSLTFQHQNSA